MKDSFLVKSLNSKREIIVNKSFHLIYDKYSHLVMFIASKYLSNSLDSEDILNEVFMTLFEKRDSITNLKAFLATVAKNKAINFAKRQSKEIIVDSDALECYSTTGSYSDLINLMSHCLSKEEMTIVIKHCVYGITIPDLAISMNANKNTIQAEYRRSLGKVRKYMEANNEKK